MRLKLLGVAGSAAIFFLGGCQRDNSSASVHALAANSASEAKPDKQSAALLPLPNGALSEDTLERYGFAAMDFKKKDEFSPTFNDAPLIGRRFSIDLPFDKFNSSFSYFYDVDKQEFTVSVLPTSNDHEGSYEPRFDYLIVKRDTVYSDPIPMSNAFGATKNVTPVSNRVVGIGSPGNVYMGVIRKMKESTHEMILYTQLSKTITISPDEARAAAAGMTMKVEGVVVKPTDAHAITCSKAETAATMDYAYQQSWQECVIAVRLSKITIQSAATGIIAEWADSDRALHVRKR